MKGNVKKRICKLLIAALVFTVMPLSGFNYIAYGQETAENTVYPSSFDLREQNVVTSVKNQGMWQTCWGFSAIAASEISILSELREKEGYEAYGENPDLLDLSERHLAWFANTPLFPDNEVYPDQAGEGQYAAGFDYEDNLGVFHPMGIGGTFVGATAILSSGIGPMYESAFPYKNNEDEVIALNNDGGIKYLIRVPEEEIEKTEEEVEKDNGYLYCYATNDYDRESGWYDWSIDESYRFGTAFELAESNLLPSPAGKDENGRYEYNAQATLAIKDELIQGRGVSVMFHGQSGMGLEGEAADYINIPAYAQYSWSEDGSVISPNHGVCIVGWDDDYSRDNFLEGHKPPADGAWIVKNSYGAKDNRFPGKYDWGVEGTGYFYLSYYDMGLVNPETFDYDTEDNFEPGDAGYFIIDQYDLMPIRSIISNSSEDMVKMANVFGAQEDEVLRSVSVETVNPGTNVTLDIYMLEDDAEDPEDGELLDTLNMTCKYGGYHRTNLEKGLYIPEGRYYSIVATLSSGEMYEYLTPVSASEEFALENGLNFYCKSVINEGESFLFSGSDGWEDWSYKSKELMEGDENYIGAITDNFSLKGYSDPATMLDIELDTVNSKNTYKAGDEITFTLNIKNLKDYDIHNVAVESSLTDLAESGMSIIEEIPAGETENITYTYKLTNKDISNGQISENIVVSLPDDKNFEPVLASMAVYLKSSGVYSHSSGGGSSSTVNYTLKFDTNGGSALNSVTRSADSVVSLTSYKPEREGYTFEGWYSDRELTKAVISVTLKSDMTVYARWTENKRDGADSDNKSDGNKQDGGENGRQDDNRLDISFDDVAPDSYYADAVSWAVRNNITTGRTEAEFAPDGSCTRAEMVTFLWRLAGSPEPEILNAPFTDVDMSMYYAKAVLWAAEKGITAGISEARFGPDETVNRAQTVTFIFRAAQLLPRTDLLTGQTSGTASLSFGVQGKGADISFSDVDMSAYYADAISWAVKNGITEGVGNAVFGTDLDCTRAQIVTLLFRWAQA